MNQLELVIKVRYLAFVHRFSDVYLSSQLRPLFTVLVVFIFNSSCQHVIWQIIEFFSRNLNWYLMLNEEEPTEI